MRHSLEGKDHLLLPYFKKYAAILNKNKADYVAEDVVLKRNWGEILFKMKWNFFEFWRKK